MKKGKEPLRTFSDLMQFYQHKTVEPTDHQAPNRRRAGSARSRGGSGDARGRQRTGRLRTGRLRAGCLRAGCLRTGYA